jgi:phage tail sheath protein FI
MAYDRPGVYVRETPFTTNLPSRSASTVAAFVGTAERGPATPTLITSWADYKAKFGELSQSYDLGYAVYQYFANGGADAYVSRVLDTTAVEATYAYTGTVTGASGTSTLFTLAAATKGGWGNNVSTTLTFDQNTLVTPSSAPKVQLSTLFAMSVNVLSASGALVEVERWQELSFDPASSRYFKTVLELYSSYVKVQGTPATIGSATTIAVSGISAGTYSTTFSLANGSDATAPNTVAPDVEWATAVTNLATVAGPLVINLVGQTSSTRVNQALAYAASRADSFVIIDCPLTASSKIDMQTTISSYSTTDGSYGAVYFPALKMYDPSKSGPAAVRDTFPGGAIAGAFVRSEKLRGVAKAPAGYSLDLQNVFGLVATVNDADQGELYSTNHVNCIRMIPGGTAIVNGARTLAKIRPDKYITVRRTLGYLRTVLQAQTQFALFEPNDERLWNRINVSLTSVMTDFWAKGNLKGSSPSQAFYILCNSTNNTQASVEDGYVNIEVGVALQYPAEFVVINLTQFAGGSAAGNL